MNEDKKTDDIKKIRKDVSTLKTVFTTPLYIALVIIVLIIFSVVCCVAVYVAQVLVQR